MVFELPKATVTEIELLYQLEHDPKQLAALYLSGIDRDAIQPGDLLLIRRPQ